MTKHRDFKALVRERMQKTGERYTAARAQLAGKSPVPSFPPQTLPGVLTGYDTFGGIQSGTAAVRNTLASMGHVSPFDGAPYKESWINGLCGGPGFLYAVFEYKGWPPMLSLALGSRSMPYVYIAEGLSRIGMKVTSNETTSATSARKALDAALAGGKAALCVTDAASLPWTGLPKAFVGGGPHVVAVAGRDGDDFWIDDRAARPRRIGASQLATARAAYRHAKNRLVTFDGALPGYDARHALRAAIADTAKRYVEPAVPKSFWVNCGFSGLDKWRQMLVDAKDKGGVGRRSSRRALAPVRDCSGCTSRSSVSRRRRPGVAYWPSFSTMPPGRSRPRRSPRPLPTIVKQACCGPRSATWWPAATTRQSVRHAGSRTSASKAPTVALTQGSHAPTGGRISRRSHRGARSPRPTRARCTPRSRRSSAGLPRPNAQPWIS